MSNCKGCKKKCSAKLTLIDTEELNKKEYSDSDFESAERFKIHDEVKALEGRNFFNSCPQKFEYLPEAPCPHGQAQRDDNGKITKEPSCDWYIESERDNYCFWSFIRRRSDPDGNMLPMLQSEIAAMFGCSPTKIHFIIKDALQKLKDNGYLEYLAELSDNIPGPEELEEEES